MTIIHPLPDRNNRSQHRAPIRAERLERFLVRVRNSGRLSRQLALPLMGRQAGALSVLAPPGRTVWKVVWLPNNAMVDVSRAPPDCHIDVRRLNYLNGILWAFCTRFVTLTVHPNRLWDRLSQFVRKRPCPDIGIVATLPAIENHRRRTVFVSHSLEFDGAPLSLLTLARGLQETGTCAPVLLALSDGPLRAAWEQAGIPVQVIPLAPANIRNRADYLRSTALLREWLTMSGASLVHANTVHTFPAIAAGHSLGLPTVWNPRESEPWWDMFRDWPTSIREEALGCFHLTDRLIFVAEATRRAWSEAHERDDALVILNALDPCWLGTGRQEWLRAEARAALGLADHEMMILTLGTLCERKGQLDLVAALALARPEHLPALQVVMAGYEETGYGQRIRQAVAALPGDLPQRVHFLQAKRDVTHLYRAADLFVCSSRIESYPRVILEAMAFGLPIISTSVFGISEQIEDNESGRFYPPGDAEALARLLEELASPEARLRLGNGAHIRFSKLLSFADMIEAYSKVHAELVSSYSTR